MYIFLNIINLIYLDTNAESAGLQNTFEPVHSSPVIEILNNSGQLEKQMKSIKSY